MGASHYVLLALTSLACLVLAEDLLFPYMHGLNYSEYDQAVKLGLTAHVCKDEAEWRGMTTADFAKYKAIIIPDPQCNTSLNTLKFLEDTKTVWSPAVTGNMVIIGTDPSFHAKWFKLAGAYAMMQDAISLVSTGKDGTGMYFSLSCYYQSDAAPVVIETLSEIGNFQVRGNLSHPCLNDAHLVAKSDVMTLLNDEIASNWNCSVHEAFSEYPRTGAGGFQALAIALNATGPGKQSFGDGTSGIPYIIARGATPAGCGNNKTETEFDEECDDGVSNGTPGSLCSSTCKCLFGMITPGVCRSNTMSSSFSLTPSSTLSTNSSSMATSTSLRANSSSIAMYTTVTAWPSPSNFSRPSLSSIESTSGPVTITVFPPGPAPPSSTAISYPASALSSSVPVSNDPALPIAPPKTITVEPPSSPGSAPGTVTVLPPAPTESAPRTVTVGPPGSPISPPVSESDTHPGDVTITAPGLPDTNPPPGTGAGEPSKAPGSLPITVTVPGIPGIQPPNGTVSGEPPHSPGKPPVTVTAPGQPGTSLLSPLDPSGGIPPAVTVTADPSRQSGTLPGSQDNKPSSGPGTIPDSQTTALMITVTALPGQPGKSSRLNSSYSSAKGPAGTDSAAPSEQPGQSGTSPGRGSLPVPSQLFTNTKTVDDTTGQPVTSTRGTQTGSDTLRPTGDATSISRPVTTVKASGDGSPALPGAPSSLVVSGSPSSVASGTPGTPSIPPVDGPPLPSGAVPGMPGTASLGPLSTLESSQASYSPIGGSGTLRPSMSSVHWNTSSRTGFPSASQMPGETNSDMPSGSYSGPPATVLPSDVNSNAPSGTFSGPPATGTPSRQTSGVLSKSLLPGSSIVADSSGSPKQPSSGGSSGIIASQSNKPYDPSKSTVSSGASSAVAVIGTDSDGLPRAFTTSLLGSGSAGTAVPTATNDNGGKIPLPNGGIGTSFPSPSAGSCDTWIGIEIIYMVEITEVCPKGSTVTETITECVATMTRSICQTSATNLPCYPCIAGTPASSHDLATVTVTSCSTSTEPTVTVTVQLCSTCTTTTYIGTVPGYTPGTPCHACTSSDEPRLTTQGAAAAATSPTTPKSSLQPSSAAAENNMPQDPPVTATPPPRSSPKATTVGGSSTSGPNAGVGGGESGEGRGVGDGGSFSALLPQPPLSPGTTPTAKAPAAVVTAGAPSRHHPIFENVYLVVGGFFGIYAILFHL